MLVPVACCGWRATAREAITTVRWASIASRVRWKIRRVFRSCSGHAERLLHVPQLVVGGDHLAVAFDRENTVTLICPAEREHENIDSFEGIEISPFIHFGIKHSIACNIREVATAVDHPYILLGKTERMNLSFRIVRMEHLVFLILPLYLEERYAGKDIRRNVAAAALGFMPVDAATIRPDPFALPNGAIPNAGKPRSVSKHPIPAHSFYYRSVHKLTLPR